MEATTKLVTAGERLLYAIDQRGMTVTALGHAAGVKKQTISEIAKRDGMNSGTLFPLADALEVEPRWLAVGSGPMEKQDKIDRKILADILTRLSREIESRNTSWPVPYLCMVAVDLYAIWMRTGELPEIGQAVDLLGSHI